jgi:hypothetical protein
LILLHEQVVYQNRVRQFLVHTFLKLAAAKVLIKRSLLPEPERVLRLWVRSVAITRVKHCSLRY